MLQNGPFSSPVDYRGLHKITASFSTLVCCSSSKPQKISGDGHLKTQIVEIGDCADYANCEDEYIFIW